MHQKPFARKKFETANIERKRQVDDDTVELVRLAKELNDSIEGTDRNARPGDIMVKAELIEKLAHSVKEKMKLTVKVLFSATGEPLLISPLRADLDKN